MFGKKDTQEICAVCGEPAVLTKPSKLDAKTPPVTMTIAQHSHPIGEVPISLYFCADHAETLCGFVAYLIEDHEKKTRESAVIEKLKSLKVGTVLTVIEEKPHPMPNEEMKKMLEDSPFSQIWKQQL